MASVVLLTLYMDLSGLHAPKRFQFCDILRWKISINSLYLFWLLTFLARLSKQLRFRNQEFPIPYLSDCFWKSTTTRVADIECYQSITSLSRLCGTYIFLSLQNILSSSISYMEKPDSQSEMYVLSLEIMSFVTFVVLFVKLRYLEGNNLSCFLS